MPDVLGQPSLVAPPAPLSVKSRYGSYDPKHLRAFDDPGATRRDIYDNVLKGFSEFQPIETARHRLRLSDVHYADPDKISLADEKRAILRGDTLSRRLRGTWVLETLEGQPVDERKVTVARVPHLTDEGTYVLNGTKWTLSSQPRLLPGVYTRRQDNGELESHVNVMPGKGLSHRIHLDPESGIFKMRVAQAELPLLPILKALGATEQQIRNAWGNKLWTANAIKDNPAAIEKLLRKLKKPDAGPDPMTRSATLRGLLEAMQLDPEVTQRTLGKPFGNVSAEQVMATTAKLLSVSRGEADPDDRDHLVYQKVYGAPDLFSERVSSAARVLRPLVWRAGFKGSLDPVAAGALSRHMQGAITDTGLGSPLEEVNSLEVLDQLTRINRMGVGGISSADSIPGESRAVQPSYANFVDPLRTPESMAAGVDLRLSTSTRRAQDGTLYSPFRDPRTGELLYKSPRDIADLTIAFPGEIDSGKKHVAALQGGKMRYVRRRDVDLVIPEMEDTFNHLSNLVPLKSAVKGQRVAMGSRYLTQALPLVAPEAPLVRSGVPWANNLSYDELYGKNAGALKAEAPGIVESVEPGKITIKGEDGQLREYETYNWHPANRKTAINSTPAVQVGQPINKGDLLARSNFTDERGVAAPGLNLRTAYYPWQGLSYEDASAISESAARRLSSTHLYQHGVEWDDGLRGGKRHFQGLFPSAFNRKQLEVLDDDGVVRIGQVVQEGDPLVLASRARERTHNQVTRSKDSSFADATTLWDHHTPGIVRDVEKTPKGVFVSVTTDAPMQVGDKLSGRYGDKGVISQVVRDEDMPTDANGRPYELLVNPQGVISRSNPAQVVEAVLGKIARLTGKPYTLKDFGQIKDWAEFAQNELAKNGLSDTETVIDPRTGRRVPGILTGERFMMKLHHMSAAKGQGRGAGGGYTSEGTPAKGGASGSKRLGLLDLNAYLSHGAHGAVRDLFLTSGQRNTDFWSAFLTGKAPPAPGLPLVNRKFFELLRASGVNPVRENHDIRVMAMTNKDVDELAGDREIKTGQTVDWRGGMKPIAGGLFDITATGGHGGSRWSSIPLHEPMLNPVMADPARRLLGLTQAGFRDVLAGKKELAEHGSGPAAIAQALTSIDLDREIASSSERVRGSRGASRDDAVRKLRYLKKAKEMGLHPGDWVLKRAPVLPPMFRPVSLMQATKQPLVADLNLLYKDLLEANDNLLEAGTRIDDVGEERLALYDALAAVTGLGDPVNPATQEKKAEGALAQVFSHRPKFSYLQRKLLSTTTDLVGRAVIAPDADLDMDSVGLPENQAWEVYRPFIIRRLVRRGMPPLQAAQEAKEHTARAKTAMIDEMGERPVRLNRAPVLHRYGVMAFWPKLVSGDTIKISPLITKGFGADFDGDMMNFSVPVSDDAVKDAVEKMLPSKNLLSIRDFQVHQLPSNEFASGLFEGSTAKKNRPEHVFKTTKDVIAAWRAGEIDASDPVVVLEP